MKRNDLKNELSQLNKTDLLIVLWYARLRWLRHKVSRLTPVRILIPTTLLQMIFFIFTIGYENSLAFLAVGNLLIVSIAILPSTLSRPKPTVHWVKNYVDKT